MPVIARFYGMTIKMYLLGKEHNPPHIHALYGDYNGIIDIQTLDMMEGDLPGKGLAMVREWMAAHQQLFSTTGLDVMETGKAPARMSGVRSDTAQKGVVPCFTRSNP